MLRINLSIFFLFLCFTVSSQEVLQQVEDFGKNPGNLKMYTYIPKNLNQSTKVPLIFVLHGCTQSAEMIARETGWNKLADSLNLIVVYPEQKQINNAAKCFNFYLGFESKKDKGEVASLKQMIDFCFKNYYLDSSKVFITGMSAGGAMSNAMLNAYPEIFNAGALLAAPSNLSEKLNKAAKKQPRVAILQGEKDKIVPKSHAKKILRQWLIKNVITESKFTLYEEYLENPLLTAKYFYNESKELQIVTIIAQDVKHKLLIKPGKHINQGGEMDFHTSDVNFHSTYWIANFFGLTDE